MAALNPFFDDADDSESAEEESGDGGLPDPVKVTTGDSKSVTNKKGEKDDDETLELNVNPSEFEELGGAAAINKEAQRKRTDNGKDKDEDDVEIIDTSKRMNKKTTPNAIIHPESRPSSEPSSWRKRTTLKSLRLTVAASTPSSLSSKFQSGGRTVGSPRTERWFSTKSIL